LRESRERLLRTLLCEPDTPTKVVNVAMHKSRLGAVVIDCQAEDVEVAAAFWSQALGWSAEKLSDPSDASYRRLDSPPDEVSVLVQAVAHASRVHLDIETDNIEAEVRRLEQLGAKRVAHVKRWWVMEAPTGQRFCVVRPQRADFETEANVWDGTPPGLVHLTPK
jgi:predicted enzyme related to lactoylglutathione lyase